MSGPNVALVNPTNRLKVVTVDLSIPHTKASVGLAALAVTFRWLTVDVVTTAAQLQFVQTDGSQSDLFTAEQSARFQEHQFLDVLVTNAAAPGGSLKIVVGWQV